jgi:integrase
MSRAQLTKAKYLADSERMELERILIAYPGRDSLLIKLALATGARASELLAITRADLDSDNRAVHIHGIKNSADREIPLTETLWRELTTYADSLPTNQLFSIKYRRLEQIWAHYRPVKKTFHALRHTFAISLFKRTQDIRLVKVALGHRNIENTMIYLDYCYSQSELRAAIVGVA